MQGLLLSALYDRKAVVLCVPMASFTQLRLGMSAPESRTSFGGMPCCRARLVRQAEGVQLRVRRSRGHQA